MKSHLRWRSYQRQVNKQYDRFYNRRSIFRYIVLTPVVSLLIYCLLDGIVSIASNYQPETKIQTKVSSKVSKSSRNERYGLESDVHFLKKADVQHLLSGHQMLNIEEQKFKLIEDRHTYYVQTSLDIPFQEYLLKTIKKSISPSLAIVAMEPTTGRILAMVGYDKQADVFYNPCLDARFPAASLFKIVTAAAAIEVCGLDENTELLFNGRKHTLYRKQLIEDVNRYTTKLTLARSFAQSINPVFGKLGAIYLGKPALETYAKSFGFNQDINFELPVTKSVVYFSEKPYKLAEIASGFNRETLISPIHAAILCSSILNDGKIPEPSIIDSVIDEQGLAIYKFQTQNIQQAINEETCAIMKKLMHETITTGTCRKSFRRSERDKIMSKLNIGGKSGSINNETQDIRFDWFVGFAENKNENKQIVIAAVVAHQKYIGTKSSQYARAAIREYYRINGRLDNYASQ